METINTEAFELNPQQNLDTKNNFQRFLLVEQDGSILERIILFIPNNELREEIICNHFLSQYVKLFVKEPIGVKYVSRDKPWDFVVDLSNNENLIIEITAIADQDYLFKKYKYEERIMNSAHKEKIEFYELAKLAFNFPNEEIEKQIDYYKSIGTLKNDLVLNHHFKREFIFFSRFEENIATFKEILKQSIEKKTKKNHPNKNDVTLIIDNRTITFLLKDIQEQLETMTDYFESLPFKEVWLYTGYYSDLDGSNAEYSFLALKLNSERTKMLYDSILPSA